MFQSKRPQKGWLTIGYQLFAEDGPEGIQIERIARILQQNKSSFYHFFVNKEMFVEELIQMHRMLADEMTGRTWKLDTFDPGFINLMVEYKDSILFHRQLIRNGQFSDFRKTYDAVNNKIDKAILPLWAKEVNLPRESAFNLFEMVRDTFYSRMNPKNMSADLVRSIVAEAKVFLAQMKKERLLAE